MPCRALVLGLPKKQENETRKHLRVENRKRYAIIIIFFADLDMSFDSLASDLRA